MSWLKINGIEMARVVALSGDPSGTRRDIGSKSETASGAMVVTRQTSKRDLKFTTKPLTGAQAFAVEGLLMGDSNVWPFDAHYYSSKGVVGTASAAPPDVQVQATTKLYGAGALEVADAETWQTPLDTDLPWTVAVWGKGEGGGDPWVHYVARSDGAQWVDGLRNDSFTMSGVFSTPTNTLIVGGIPGVAKFFDDLVVSPFLWLEDWAEQVFEAGAPFGQAPFLTASGDLVREAATRTMVGTDVSEKVIVAGLGGSLQRDARVLSVDLKGV
jgi:hypothetical protein